MRTTNGFKTKLNGTHDSTDSLNNETNSIKSVVSRSKELTPSSKLGIRSYDSAMGIKTSVTPKCDISSPIKPVISSNVVNGVPAEKPAKPEKPERKLNSRELIEKQKNWTSHFSKSRTTAGRYEEFY